MIKRIAKLAETTLEKCIATFTIKKTSGKDLGSNNPKSKSFNLNKVQYQAIINYFKKKSNESKKECLNLLLKDKSLIDTATSQINKEKVTLIVEELYKNKYKQASDPKVAQEAINTILDTFFTKYTNLNPNKVEMSNLNKNMSDINPQFLATYIVNKLQNIVETIVENKCTFLKSGLRYYKTAQTYDLTVDYIVKDPTIKEDIIDPQNINTGISPEYLDSIIESDKENLSNIFKDLAREVTVEVKKDYYFKCIHSGASSDSTPSNPTSDETDEYYQEISAAELESDRDVLEQNVSNKDTFKKLEKIYPSKNTQVDVSWDDTSEGTATIKIPSDSFKEALDTLAAIYTQANSDGFIIQTTEGKTGKTHTWDKYKPYTGDIKSAIEKFNTANSKIHELFDNLMFMLKIDIATLNFDTKNLPENISKLNLTQTFILNSMYYIARYNRVLQHELKIILKQVFAKKNYNDFIQKKETAPIIDDNNNMDGLDIFQLNFSEIDKELQRLGVEPTYNCDATQLNSLSEDKTLKYLITIYTEQIIKKQSKNQVTFEGDWFDVPNKRIRIGSDDDGPTFLDETIKTTDPLTKGQMTPLSSLHLSDIIQKEKEGGNLATRTRYVLKRLINEALSFRNKYKTELHTDQDLTSLRDKIKKLTSIFSFTKNEEIMAIRFKIPTELQPLFLLVNSSDDNELDNIILELAKRESESIENKRAQDDPTYKSDLNKNKKYNINIGVYSVLFDKNTKEGIKALTEKIDKINTEVKALLPKESEEKQTENKQDQGSTPNNNQQAEQKKEEKQTDINPVYLEYLDKYIDVACFPAQVNIKKNIESTYANGAALSLAFSGIIDQITRNKNEDEKNPASQSQDSKISSEELKSKIRKSLFEKVDDIKDTLPAKVKNAYTDVVTNTSLSNGEEIDKLSDEKIRILNNFLNECGTYLKNTRSILDKRVLALCELYGHINYLLYQKTGNYKPLNKFDTRFNIRTFNVDPISNTELNKKTQDEAKEDKSAKEDIKAGKLENSIHDGPTPDERLDLIPVIEDAVDKQIRSDIESLPKTERELTANVELYRKYAKVYKADNFTNICKFYENKDNPNESTLKLNKGYGFAEKNELDNIIKAFEEQKPNEKASRVITSLKAASTALDNAQLSKCIVCYIKWHPIKGIPPVVYKSQENGLDKWEYYLPYTQREKAKTITYYTGYKYKCPKCNEETDCYLTYAAIKKAEQEDESYLKCSKCKSRIYLPASEINNWAKDTNFLKKHKHVIYDNLDYHNPIYGKNVFGESRYTNLWNEKAEEVYTEHNLVPPHLRDTHYSPTDIYNVVLDLVEDDSTTTVPEDADLTYELFKAREQAQDNTAKSYKENILLNSLYDQHKIPEEIRSLSGQAHYWLDTAYTENMDDHKIAKITEILKDYKISIDNATNLEDSTKAFINNDYTALEKQLAYFSQKQEKRTYDKIDTNDAFIQACKEGNETKVKELLKTQKNIDALDYYDKTALMWASEQGHLGVVKLLIDAGADVNATNKKQTLTALNFACFNHQLEVVQELINAGADVNKIRKNSYTLLMAAIVDGDLELAQVLINAGADVNAQDKYGNTALIYALENKHFDIVKLLLQKDADDVNPLSTALRVARRVKTNLEKDTETDPQTINFLNGAIDILNKKIEDLYKEKQNNNVEIPTTETPSHLNEQVPGNNTQPSTSEVNEQEKTVSVDNTKEQNTTNDSNNKEITDKNKDENKKPEDSNKVTSSLGFTIYKSAKKHIVRK